MWGNYFVHCWRWLSRCIQECKHLAVNKTRSPSVGFAWFWCGIAWPTIWLEAHTDYGRRLILDGCHVILVPLQTFLLDIWSFVQLSGWREGGMLSNHHGQHELLKTWILKGGGSRNSTDSYRIVGTYFPNLRYEGGFWSQGVQKPDRIYACQV